LHWFDTYRTAIILDEVHHLCLGKPDQAGDNSAAWTKAISPLVDKAVHIVLMTGTPERHDGKAIPFLDYEEGHDGVLRPQLDIEYSRREAVRDKAKLEIEINYCDGFAEYVDNDGLKTVDISQAKKEENSKAVRACLSDRGEYTPGVMKKAVDSWLDYRLSSGYMSKLIIVCHEQKAVTRNAEWLKENYHHLKIAQAKSEDGSSASQKQIEKFKKHCSKGGADVLLTVGMAYEGLDVPSATDIIALTHIRSKPWLEQCLDRVVRIDYGSGIAYEHQRAVAWIMDDPKMQEIAEQIQSEQRLGVDEREKKKKEGAGGDPTEGDESVFLVIGSEHKNVRLGSTKEDLSQEQSCFIQSCRNQYPALAAVRNDQLLQMRADGQFPEIETLMPVPVIPTKEEDLNSYLRNPAAKDILGKKIDALTKQYCQKVAARGQTPDWSAGNRAIKDRFGKQRKDMGIAELYDAHLYAKDLVAGAYQGSATV
jgi:superfamily II DNA or RNA helicase